MRERLKEFINKIEGEYHFSGYDQTFSAAQVKIALLQLLGLTHGSVGHHADTRRQYALNALEIAGVTPVQFRRGTLEYELMLILAQAFGGGDGERIRSELRRDLNAIMERMSKRMSDMLATKEYWPNRLGRVALDHALGKITDKGLDEQLNQINAELDKKSTELIEFNREFELATDFFKELMQRPSFEVAELTRKLDSLNELFDRVGMYKPD